MASSPLKSIRCTGLLFATIHVHLRGGDSSKSPKLVWPSRLDMVRGDIRKQAEERK
ncbi:MAG: hypothetical protein R3C59_04135 [Planctomycetaceae bacterium]